MNALILAAGAASRFGAPKALLPAGVGETVLSRVLELALRVVPGHVIVVLGRDPELMQAEIERCRARGAGWARVAWVINAAYQAGLSGSLRQGLEALGPQDATLVLLADQPAIDLAALASLLKRYQEGRYKAVSAAFAGKQRPPVVLGPELYGELHRLRGDRGAKGVLERHQAEVALVEWDKGVWLCDIDTWAEYASLALELGWPRDPGPRLPVVRVPDPQLIQHLRETLMKTPPAYLTSEVPLCASHTKQLVIVPAGTLPGVTHVVMGDLSTPQAHLHLLRRAALTLLDMPL